MHLPSRFVQGEFGLLDLALALRLEIRLLRPELQDLVLRVDAALLRIGQFLSPLLQIAPRRVALREQTFEVLDVDRKIIDALARRLDDLFKCGFQLLEVLALGGEFARYLRFEVGVFVLALLEHFDRRLVLLFDVGLNDLGDRLTQLDVVADRDGNGLEPAGSSGYRVDHVAAIADQDSLAGDAGGHASENAPHQRGRHRNEDHQRDNPVGGPGDDDKMIKLLGRGRTVECRGAKCPLRLGGRPPILRLSERVRGRHICTQSVQLIE